MLNHSEIVRFVDLIEKKKGFVRNPDKVFRHIVSEIAELDSKIHQFETMNKEYFLTNSHAFHSKRLKREIAFECLDIVFLACYMADIFGMNLNHVIKERMKAIAKQYDVEFEGAPKKSFSRAGLGRKDLR